MLHDLRYSLRSLTKRPSFAGGHDPRPRAGGRRQHGGLQSHQRAAAAAAAGAHGRRARDSSITATSAQRTFPTAGIASCAQKIDVFSGMAARGGDAGRLRDRRRRHSAGRARRSRRTISSVLGRAPRIGRTIRRQTKTVAPPRARSRSSARRCGSRSSPPIPSVIGRALRIDAGAFWPVAMPRAGATTPSSASCRRRSPAREIRGSRRNTGCSIEPRSTDYSGGAGRKRSDAVSTTRPVVPIGRLKPGVPFAQARAAVELPGRDMLRSARRERCSLERRDVPAASTARRDAAAVPGRLFHGRAAHHSRRSARSATLLLVIAGVNLGGMLLARGVVAAIGDRRSG